MNSRERLTRLFNNKEIDRVPIWLLAPFHKVTYYADIYNIPSYNKIVQYIDMYCDTLDRRNYDSGFCYNKNKSIKQEYFEDVKNGVKTTYSKISYKDIDFTHYIKKDENGTKLKYYIEDASELEKILEIPYVAPKPDISKYAKEKEELGDKGLMMLDLGDPLYPLYHLMSAENFSISTLTDYDKIIEFVDEMYRRVYEYYKYFLENNIGEVFFIVGAEFAGPPLVAPTKFNEMCAKYLKGIVDLIRSYGKKSIVHYHGQLFSVLDGMRAINPDGLHTIEAPPIGDCTIKQARTVLKDMILIGNIQYDDLAHCDKDNIERQVIEVMEQGKSGRLILSPTAGPYEDIISEKMVENYITFIETGIKYGKY